VFGLARADMTYLPRLHTAEEDVAFFSGIVDRRDAPRCLVEVAEAAVAAVGFSAVRDDWLDHLYVSPLSQGRGIGSALLARAQAARPGGLTLWVFEQNVRARSLYARAGFHEIERTDGSRNEERRPDVMLRWPGSAV
jgi:GNAT superfamily N-acetyltransferase